MRKLFFVVAAVVAIPVAIAVTFFVYKFIAGMMVGGSAGEVHDRVYQCERIAGERVGYVYVRGFGEDDPDAAYAIDEAAKMDSRYVGLLDYDYDEALELEQITNIFLEKLEDFVGAKRPDALVVFGFSAGGTVISSAAHALNFDGPVQLHTMASPLSGYHVAELFLADREGYLRELAAGIQAYLPPTENVSAVHHKTVTDKVLVDFCENAKKFCDPLKVQNNNLKGSADFYYPQESHNSIVMTVVDKVMACQK